MFAPLTSVLMIGSLLVAQNPLPAPAALPAQSPQVPVAATLIVPAGTVIPLTLMTSIQSKSTKPGDSVRATVAFPVTVGSQLAIPAGAFAEGVVNRVVARPLANQAPSVSIHFTRLVFANGYSVSLSAENTQSFLLRPSGSTSTIEVAELMPPRLPGSRFAMGLGQIQTPIPSQTLPRMGPSPGLIAGIGLGAMAAIGIGMFAWMHHRANTYNFVVFDVGWQFQMVLDDPVTIDMARAAAAAAAPNVN